MISSIVSRLVILVFGTLYPAYASYKAVRTKNVKEYVKWMMYWIVFALFTCAETFTDVFLSFWFPFYYEIKIILVLWLLSPATKGSSILYRKFVHPMLSRREQEIDEYIAKAKEQGYSTVLHLGTKGVNYATTVIMQTAIKGGGGLVQQLRRSYSLSDLSTDTDMGDVNRNSKSKTLRNIPDEDLEETDDVTMDPRMRRSRGYSPRRSASGSGRVEMYFPEVDVDVRQHGSHPRDPSITLSQIRSSEDVSSGYSSGEALYGGHHHPPTRSEGPTGLVRTASVGGRAARTRAATRTAAAAAPSTPTGAKARAAAPTEDSELWNFDEAAYPSQEQILYHISSPSSSPFVSAPLQRSLSQTEVLLLLQQLNTAGVSNVPSLQLDNSGTDVPAASSSSSPPAPSVLQINEEIPDRDKTPTPESPDPICKEEEVKETTEKNTESTTSISNSEKIPDNSSILKQVEENASKTSSGTEQVSEMNNKETSAMDEDEMNKATLSEKEDVEPEKENAVEVLEEKQDEETFSDAVPIIGPSRSPSVDDDSFIDASSEDEIVETPSEDSAGKLPFDEPFEDSCPSISESTTSDSLSAATVVAVKVHVSMEKLTSEENKKEETKENEDSMIPESILNFSKEEQETKPELINLDITEQETKWDTHELDDPKDLPLDENSQNQEKDPNLLISENGTVHDTCSQIAKNYKIQDANVEAVAEDTTRDETSQIIETEDDSKSTSQITEKNEKDTEKEEDSKSTSQIIEKKEEENTSFQTAKQDNLEMNPKGSASDIAESIICDIVAIRNSTECLLEAQTGELKSDKKDIRSGRYHKLHAPSPPSKGSEDVLETSAAPTSLAARPASPPPPPPPRTPVRSSPTPPPPPRTPVPSSPTPPPSPRTPVPSSPTPPPPPRTPVPSSPTPPPPPRTPVPSLPTPPPPPPPRTPVPSSPTPPPPPPNSPSPEAHSSAESDDSSNAVTARLILQPGVVKTFPTETPTNTNSEKFISNPVKKKKSSKKQRGSAITRLFAIPTKSQLGHFASYLPFWHNRNDDKQSKTSGVSSEDNDSGWGASSSSATSAATSAAGSSASLVPTVPSPPHLGLGAPMSTCSLEYLPYVGTTDDLATPGMSREKSNSIGNFQMREMSHSPPASRRQDKIS